MRAAVLVIPMLLLTSPASSATQPAISGEKSCQGFVVEANDYVDPDSGDFGMPLVVVDYVPVADVKDVNNDGNPDIDSFLQNLQVTGTWGPVIIASSDYVTRLASGEHVLALRDQSGNVLAYLAVKVLGTVTVDNVDYYAILLYSADYNQGSGTVQPRNVPPSTRIEVIYPSGYYDPNGVPIQYWNKVRLTITSDPSSLRSAGGPVLRIRLSGCASRANGPVRRRVIASALAALPLLATLGRYL